MLAADRTGVDYDALLLLLLVGFHLVARSTILEPIVLVAAIVYLALSLGAPGLSGRHRRWRHLAKVGLLAIIVFFLTLLPAGFMIAFRLAGEAGSDAFVSSRSIHDGALQTEDAIRFLLQGQNPYRVTYEDTLLPSYPILEELEVEANPATYHYVYLPFTFLGSVPVYLAAQAVLGWYDQRLTYGLLLLALLLLVPSMTRDRARQLLLVAVVALNPLLVGYVPVGIATGVNDYAVLALLVMSAALLVRGRSVASAVLLAAAAATKQTAWFAVPLWGLLLWRTRTRRAPLRTTITPLLAFVLVWGMVVLPFVLWSPSDFVDDTVSYLSGSLPTSFPIKGFGLSGLFVAAGILPDPKAYFPFWVFQALLGVPALLYAGRRLWRSPSLRELWLGYGMVLLAVNFAARYFHTNHLGFIVAVLAIGILADRDRLFPSGSRPENGT